VLETGGSKIDMAAASITAKSTQVKVLGATVDVTADATAKVSGAIVQIAGSGMTEVKGGIVKIN
jgi:type VI secretion system secreted protein VgrG